jgi:hypothetical protein
VRPIAQHDQASGIIFNVHPKKGASGLKIFVTGHHSFNAGTFAALAK